MENEKYDGKKGRLNIDDVILFICDIQDYQIKQIFHYEDMVNKTAKLIKVCDKLKIPVVVTEHYRTRYQETCQALKDVYPKENLYVFDKTLYSMWTKEVQETVTKLNRKTVVIVGVDAHVCVLQSVYDLIDNGYNVHAIVDAISAQNEIDRTAGIKHIEKKGAFLSTFELFFFELMKHNFILNMKKFILYLKNLG
jgi:nicotinamidase-related amidase